MLHREVEFALARFAVDAAAVVDAAAAVGVVVDAADADGAVVDAAAAAAVAAGLRKFFATPKNMSNCDHRGFHLNISPGCCCCC